MEEFNLEITSRYNIIFRLKIENNIAKLWQNNGHLSTIVIPENHCGCGLGKNPETHRKYPNNIKDFDFGKVISAIDFITWYGWKKTKKVNTKHSSYSLKHMIESSKEYQNACKHNNVNIFNNLGNGELILAMQLLGFKIYPQMSDGLVIGQNVYFNIPDNCLLGHKV